MKKSPCLECAGNGKTCCEDVQVYLTIGDIVRISQFIKSEIFFSFEPMTGEYICADDPTWRILVQGEDGRRRVLIQTEEQKCTFLSKNGCRLPLDVRPLLCRIYPYDFRDDGIIGIAPSCPISEMGDWEPILESLGMSLGKAEQWRSILYQELGDKKNERKSV